jgi:hypothetical protein
MPELYLKKTTSGLSPCDNLSEEELNKFKLGTLVLCKISKKQNAAFHRKLFALFTVGFKYWVPGEISCKYGKPEKNFNQFRKDCTILAGYFDINHRLDGTFRVEAKSLSFDSMSQEEREGVYSALIDVLLKNIFEGYTEQDVIQMIEKEVLNFL